MCNFQIQRSRWKITVLLLIDLLEGGVQAEGQAPMMILQNAFRHAILIFQFEKEGNKSDSMNVDMLSQIPSTGRAEKLKPQEAIPPFSLMDDSIHGRRAETLVKTAKSCWLQLSPSLLLMIPTRMWAPSSFTTVGGPPLSP